jgi:hypothetical protein
MLTFDIRKSKVKSGVSVCTVILTFDFLLFTSILQLFVYDNSLFIDIDFQCFFY